MRWLLVLCTFSVVFNARELAEGEVKHFIEVFTTPIEGELKIQLFFAISTYNETLIQITDFPTDASHKDPTKPRIKMKISPLGDAYQIHSFVLDAEGLSVLSASPYEPSRAVFDSDDTMEFTFRNLLFLGAKGFIFTQHLQVKKESVLPYGLNTDHSLPGYFPDNGTLRRIGNECFSSPEIKCGIDRDTGNLEIFNITENSNRTQYMYRTFNFTVPWECSMQMCSFENILTGETYEIPADLPTFIGDAPGKRIAMVPLLTIQSPLVLEQLKKHGKSGARVLTFWFTLVLVYILRYIVI